MAIVGKSKLHEAFDASRIFGQPVFLSTSLPPPPSPLSLYFHYQPLVMLRSLQKSVRPALSSSWRAAQPTAPGTSALGLGFSLPQPAHPTANRNRAFHNAFTAANWRQDPAAPAINENVPRTSVGPAVTKFVGIWNVPKDTTEEEIRAYLVQECGVKEDVGIRMSK